MYSISFNGITDIITIIPRFHSLSNFILEKILTDPIRYICLQNNIKCIYEYCIVTYTYTCIRVCKNKEII